MIGFSVSNFVRWMSFNERTEKIYPKDDTKEVDLVARESKVDEI